jgi:methionine aminopeptidase
MLVSCLASSSTQKMEVRCSFETSVDFHQTAGHYVPEDRTLRQSSIFEIAVVMGIYATYAATNIAST